MRRGRAAPAGALRALVAASLLVGSACGGEPPEAEPTPADTAASDTAVEAPPDYVGYVIVRGADTLGMERVLRSPGRLGVQLRIDSVGGTLLLEATTGADGLVRSITIEPRAAGSGSAPGRRATVHFEGGRVVSEVGRGDSLVVDTLDVPEGTLPYHVPSLALVEQVLLRARALEGDTVRVPLLELENGGAVHEAVVWRDSPTSVTIRIDEEDEIRLTLDAEGRVVRLVDVRRGITIDRLL